MALVLIVDDDASVRQVLARRITSAGHEVREAESSAAALADAENHEPAVVFCDVQMPGRDGVWLTGELRQRYPATAVVLVTVLSTVAPRVSMQAGVAAYLVKPFTSAALLEALSLALQWHFEALRARSSKNGIPTSRRTPR
jgi:CheY-like chemotaxis protein